MKKQRTWKATAGHWRRRAKTAEADVEHIRLQRDQLGLLILSGDHKKATAMARIVVPCSEFRVAIKRVADQMEGFIRARLAPRTAETQSRLACRLCRGPANPCWYHAPADKKPGRPVFQVWVDPETQDFRWEVYVDGSARHEGRTHGTAGACAKTIQALAKEANASAIHVLGDSARASSLHLSLSRCGLPIHTTGITTEDARKVQDGEREAAQQQGVSLLTWTRETACGPRWYWTIRTGATDIGHGVEEDPESLALRSALLIRSYNRCPHQSFGVCRDCAALPCPASPPEPPRPAPSSPALFARTLIEEFLVTVRTDAYEGMVQIADVDRAAQTLLEAVAPPLGLDPHPHEITEAQMPMPGVVLCHDADLFGRIAADDQERIRRILEDAGDRCRAILGCGDALPPDALAGHDPAAAVIALCERPAFDPQNDHDTAQQHEGARAYASGLMLAANPYPLGSNSYALWVRGWSRRRLQVHGEEPAV